MTGLTGLVIACALIVVIVWFSLEGITDRIMRESAYDEGYKDCMRVYNDFEMSPDDELLMEELKDALKLYIRHNKLYEKGDVKRINSASDWRDFKNTAWNVTVFRKEQKKG